MAAAIRLTVLTGPHKHRKFCFCGPSKCQIGRALDCMVQLSGAARDQLISRHHCQLEIDPPVLKVRDLASKNGTFVNGKKVASSPTQPAEEAAAELEHGDLLTVGGMTMRVDILDCPHFEGKTEGKSNWEVGQVVKEDCSLPC